MSIGAVVKMKVQFTLGDLLEGTKKELTNLIGCANAFIISARLPPVPKISTLEKSDIISLDSSYYFSFEKLDNCVDFDVIDMTDREPGMEDDDPYLGELIHVDLACSTSGEDYLLASAMLLWLAKINDTIILNHNGGWTKKQEFTYDEFLSYFKIDCSDIEIDNLEAIVDRFYQNIISKRGD